MSRNIAQAVTVGMLKLFKKNNINLQNLNFFLEGKIIEMLKYEGEGWGRGGHLQSISQQYPGHNRCHITGIRCLVQSPPLPPNRTLSHHNSQLSKTILVCTLYSTLYCGDCITDKVFPDLRDQLWRDAFHVIRGSKATRGHLFKGLGNLYNRQKTCVWTTFTVNKK